MIRTFLYFAIWIVFALLLKRLSADQDRRSDHGPSQWLRRISGPGLALLFLAGSFAAIDWMMSLEPKWFSTIYGALVCVGEALSTLAMMIAVVILLSAEKPMAEAATQDRLHDLGNLMLAFTMLWAYMSFAQYLIIWAGNLPEEIPWYLRRTRGGWQWVALALALFHFFLPFFVLLFRESKRQSRLLLRVAFLVLGMHWLDLVRPVVPASSEPASLRFPWAEPAHEPGGNARGRRHLHGGLHRAIEGQSLDPAQRPRFEQSDRARRRVKDVEDAIPQGRPSTGRASAMREQPDRAVGPPHLRRRPHPDRHRG